MPPQLASLLTIALIVWLFRRDFHERPNVTRALWVPVIWFFLIASRYVSQWLNLFGLVVGGDSVEEGSLIDALVFFGLIVAGVVILNKRRANISEIIGNNKWLAAFLFYCFIAVLWSDFPLVSFKRWIKILGHPIMVLILFTEPDFEQAVTRLIKRCAYLLLPISILFIKYYPNLGRGFSQWTGAGYNQGIALGKNDLGYICLILGSFFVWQLLKTLGTEKNKDRTRELVLISSFLGAIGWLLWIADSKTALVAFLVAIIIMWVLGLRFINIQFIGCYVLSALLILFVVEQIFGVSKSIIHLLGREPTLTDRTEVWADVLAIPINPVIGTGFESFWLGERRQQLSKIWTWEPNQAHNGYLETYLNLGVIGLVLLLGVLIATYRKSRIELWRSFAFGRLRLGLLFAIVVYNWTDATFKALHPIWFAFYVIAIDYPKHRSGVLQQFHEAAGESAGVADIPAKMCDQQAGFCRQENQDDEIGQNKAIHESVQKRPILC